MIPRDYSFRGRPQNYRGRGGRGNIISQIHGKKLVAENISGLGESSTSQKGNSQTFENILQENEYDDSINYAENDKREVILHLEYSDLKWRDDPWFLMNRYIDNTQFAATSYKQRSFYENLLKATDSCEITHFTSNDQKSYTFSKIIVKKIFSYQEWGLSTFKEKDYIFSEKNISIKFNYWDYISAFDKVLYYQNTKKKHTWFIKICGEVYKSPIPNWFVNWWSYHGPSYEILPEKWKNLYSEWIDLSPLMSKLITSHKADELITSMHFFIEFSIPWISKWIPMVGYTEHQTPCLYRNSFSKFWEKMNKVDPSSGKLFGAETEELIQNKLLLYKTKEMDDTPSPFQAISGKLKMKKQELSREDIIKAYMEEMKKDLKKNFKEFLEDDSKSSKSDTSMASSKLAGESQDPYEEEQDPFNAEDLESIFEKIRSEN
ncbi:hypothetical protein ACJIZ3_014248 [Penstemon smallii]|uniref:Uncharacterized protein n=1 Tax=Penstemon smallii TaxID=265156 RepID=A0ABD3RJ84_9LAMI